MKNTLEQDAYDGPAATQGHELSDEEKRDDEKKEMDLSDFDGIIASLEQQRAAIERALKALRDVSGASAPATKKRGRPAGKRAGTAGKRVLSPEGRAAIIAATKRRWAAAKTGHSKPAAKKRSGLTAAGRKRLSEAMKARWASKNPPRKTASTKR